MDSSVLKHSRIAEIVNSLVAARGGRVTYDTGCGGREMLIAAGAHLAAETGAQLTIVEARVLHSEVRALVHELQPGIRSAVISADEAALQPAGTTTGVLAVHADVLRNADVREPLLAMAHSADHLLVARHDYSDTTLDSLAAPGLVLRSEDLMLTATPPPGPRPGAAERRATTIPPGLYALVAARRSTPPSSEERKQRFLQQLNEASEEQKLGFDELAREVLSEDPAEVRQRLEQLKEQGQQRAADYPAPGPGRPADRGHGHGEEQSAAHQQHRPHGPGRT
ncbi:hypothetical protein OG613_47910 (plasmid) [Streptomyces sp. NBC_00015]|uniref:hypothetical protein n=1 Tax=Streptomyces sp. NBC_00015 TaxID=2903611 RepID=UPI002F919ED3